MANEKLGADEKKKLGARIRWARQARDGRPKITQEQLADRLGVSPQAVLQWEKGKTNPELDRLEGISAFLGVSLTWLMTGTGVPTDQTPGAVIAPKAERGRTVPKISALAAVAGNLWEARRSTTETIHTHFPCGPRSYALVISDRSNAPKYEIGDNIVIDPDSSPSPGDMVLAAIGPDERPVFRKYTLTSDLNGNSSIIELVPLNKDWNKEHIASKSDGRIVGVMTEHAEPRR